MGYRVKILGFRRKIEILGSCGKILGSAERFLKKICSGSRFFCRPGFGTAESRHVRDDVGRGGGDTAVVVPPGDQDVAVITPVG